MTSPNSSTPEKRALNYFRDHNETTRKGKSEIADCNGSSQRAVPHCRFSTLCPGNT